MSDLHSPNPVSVPLAKAYRLLNHGPTVLVTTADGIRRNVMAAAWAMPVDFDPPKVAVVIDAATLTRRMVEATGRFGLTVPCVASLDLTNAVGSVSGDEFDKFERWSIGVLPDAPDTPPRLTAGVAWLDCRVIDEPGIAARHDLIVAHVTAAWADPQAFANGRWQRGRDDLQTIHHVAGGTFFTAGTILSARPMD